MGLGLRVVVFAGAALGFAAACRSTLPTSITLDIRTDLSCDDLKTVSVAVSTPGEVDQRPPQTVTTSCSPLDQELSTVGTLVIVPSGPKDGEVGVRVLGGVTRIADRCTADSGYKGCVVARRLLRFVPEKEIEVTVDLRLECRDVSCDATSTCVPGGSCAPATIDTSRCIDAPCGIESVGGSVPLPPTDGGTGPVVLPDGGTITPPPPPPPTCAADEKSCGGRCVKFDDPLYGCTGVGCAPCAGADTTVFGCAAGHCVRNACKPGFKECGQICAPTDVAHGCGAAACTPCVATNGTASCDSGGKCALSCAGGYKLCGGLCVRVDDPTYGCSATGCSAAACPDPGGGTLVCTGTSCEIGSCPSGTKACNRACVPTDANNGCETAGSCAACAPGYVCGGSPSQCQCVPELLRNTCGSLCGGPATNNCGQPVTCPDTCVPLGTGYACNTTTNSCDCTPNPNVCNGVECGSVLNNCGQSITCTDTCKSKGFQYACSGNTCVCNPIPKSTACYGQKCGSASDGCGVNYNCGNCLGGQVCKCGGMCMSSGSMCP